MTDQMNRIPRFIVMTAAAAMPNSCRGVYCRVAVVETNQWQRPAFIGERARGCVRVVATWEKLNVGKTSACAYGRAMAKAEVLAAELNGQVAGKAA